MHALSFKVCWLVYTLPKEPQHHTVSLVLAARDFGFARWSLSLYFSLLGILSSWMGDLLWNGVPLSHHVNSFLTSVSFLGEVEGCWQLCFTPLCPKKPISPLQRTHQCLAAEMWGQWPSSQNFSLSITQRHTHNVLNLGLLFDLVGNTAFHFLVFYFSNANITGALCMLCTWVNWVHCKSFDCVSKTLSMMWLLQTRFTEIFQCYCLKHKGSGDCSSRISLCIQYYFNNPKAFAVCCVWACKFHWSCFHWASLGCAGMTNLIPKCSNLQDLKDLLVMSLVQDSTGHV